MGDKREGDRYIAAGGKLGGKTRTDQTGMQYKDRVLTKRGKRLLRKRKMDHGIQETLWGGKSENEKEQR